MAVFSTRAFTWTEMKIGVCSCPQLTISVIDFEHEAANENETYRKDHRNGKRKLIEAYLYYIYIYIYQSVEITFKDDK